MNFNYFEPPLDEKYLTPKDKLYYKSRWSKGNIFDPKQGVFQIKLRLSRSGIFWQNILNKLENELKNKEFHHGSELIVCDNNVVFVWDIFQACGFYVLNKFIKKKFIYILIF